MRASFSPTPGLGNRHLQTIWGAVLRPRPPLSLQRESWPLPDGESLDLHFAAEQPDRPGVVVLHGLEGSAHARYMLGLLHRLQREGWNAAAFDFRSCGERARRAGREARATSFYHAGKTDDLAFVVDRLRARWGPAPLAAVGFSLGGNLLLKWLGETGTNNPLSAAAAISVPFDLGACAQAIDHGGFWAFVYRERFLRSLRRKALGAVARYAGKLDARAIRACRSFAAYDGAVVAPLYGFASAEDYWARCSARGFLGDIRRPTLLIGAADDPFVPAASVPTDLIAENPALSLCWVERGGHVGFVAGTPLAPRYFAEEITAEFLAARFGTASIDVALAR